MNIRAFTLNEIGGRKTWKTPFFLRDTCRRISHCSLYAMALEAAALAKWLLI